MVIRVQRSLRQISACAFCFADNRGERLRWAERSLMRLWTRRLGVYISLDLKERWPWRRRHARFGVGDFIASTSAKAFLKIPPSVAFVPSEVTAHALLH